MALKNFYNMTLNEYLKLKLGSNETLPFETTTRQFPKGSNITNFGDVETNIYYIVSGSIEQYMRVKEDDKIIEFSFDGDFVTSLSSLLKGQESDVCVTCLTDCVVQVIPYEKINEFSHTSIITNRLYKHFIENYYLVRVKKEKDLLSKTVDERYLDLLKNRPKLIQEVPLGLIAKYLGVHPNSLSRIRRKIFSGKKAA
jgi:CRP-like cAMP-binding protein